jgi:hypothetical protein
MTQIDSLKTIGIARSESGRTWRIIYNGAPLGDDRGFASRDEAICEAGRRVCADIMDHKQYDFARRFRLDGALYSKARKMGAFIPYQQWRDEQEKR